MCGCHQQVGLTAEECRDLQHVAHLAGGLALPCLVDVGQHAQSVAALYVGQHLQSALQPRSPERMDACAVGLVEGRLEDDVSAQLLVDFNQT